MRKQCFREFKSCPESGCDCGGVRIQARQAGKTDQMLSAAPLGSKAPAIGGGHWVKVERGWKWHSGSTFPRPGGDWTGVLIIPKPES